MLGGEGVLVAQWRSMPGFAIVLACILAGCTSLGPLGPSRHDMLDETRLNARVLAVAGPLLLANAAHCPVTHNFAGLITTHRAD